MKEWEKNPRKITRINLEKLKERMIKDKDYMQLRPLLVNKIGEDFIVYAGNQRLKAAKEMGWETIWCEVSENMPENLMSERAVADNVNYGEFIIEKIAELNIETNDLKNMNIEIKPIMGDKPEVEFTKELMEENNYIVLVFDNEMDWKSAENVFELKPVQALDSKEGYKKAGVGRVISGKKILDMLIKEKYE